MRDNGYDISHIGIRIDSGDLAYLSKEARRMLDEAGFPQATICLSNGLTAETIETLINQGACFNSLGVGDNISKPEGRMGCVYKEVAITKDGIEIPKIKLSEDAVKIVNPGIKKLYRAYNSKTNKAIADIMCNKDEELTTDKLWIYSTTNDINNKLIEDFYLVPLQQTIYLNGNLVYEDKTLEETKKYCNEQMSSIDSEIKRNYMPHTYKVSGTRKYVDFKNDLIEEHRRLTLKV
jgi:nicotinate phosphoribosyltransferase